MPPPHEVATSSAPAAGPLGIGARLWNLFDRVILSLGRELRVTFLPPLMVYIAYGIQGITSIAGTFFVKEYLDLSAEWLAAVGFWAGLPWVLKMPVGHVVDLMWRWKGLLVFLGAGLIAASVGIMIGLVGYKEAMAAVMPVQSWFLLASVLAPTGYVIQDVVADAMTVEAVPHLDDDGRPVPEAERRVQHATMQMLGRVALIGGIALVAAINVWLFEGADQLAPAAKARLYEKVYWMALVIPVVSVLGVILGEHFRRRHIAAMRASGVPAADIDRALHGHAAERTHVNWWILGGGLAFAAFSIGVGSTGYRWKEEIVFAGSMAIVIFVMAKLLRELDPAARRTLLGTAIVIFIARATPAAGSGATWWQIDELGFDQSFLAKLQLITSMLTLAGMFLFRKFVAERSLAYVVGFLTVIGVFLSLPTIGMYYGLHHWTAAHTGGVVDARFIAVLDTMLESPFGQVMMIPMLAWIANSAPEKLKATFFAVMASFTNLALSASQLGTKYLNGVYTVTREVKDAATGAVKVAADYSELGELLIVVLVVGTVLPFAAIALTRLLGWRTA